MSKYEEALSKYNLGLTDQEVVLQVAGILENYQANDTTAVKQFLYSCIDLTSLGSEDSKQSIWNFVSQVNDFDGTNDMDNVAAICVYPNFVQTVKEALTANVRVASVAGGFPSSQTFQEIKVAEVSMAVSEGADEIDIVLNCGEFFDGNLQEVCEEIQELKDACREAHLKVILETGLLETAVNIKKASILSMYSGADFIKTSTGKVYPGATPEAAYVMADTIREYYQQTGRRVGLKVSGGIRTTDEALKYYAIVKAVLGEEWLTPELFRIGASSLADKLLKSL
ncbi:deoxyribose-phosphate aldolase [Bacteroidales bacterium OttesenSCG-928-L03]|nr:deoxyribose-phosphate aldolase [Bacteroidales bacterium OttesenSCG-928-L03]